MKIDASSQSSMPTAAKLVGGIVLAAVGWAMTDVVMFRHAVYQEPGINHLVFTVIGFMVGWKHVGKRAEGGYRAAWGGGFSGALIAAFWVILLMACYGVYRGMGYHAYKSVQEMLDGFVKLFVEYLMLLSDVPLLILTLSGGLLAGIFAGFAARLWR